ncbi:Hint domain-containing protein [Tateyamaria pelophila]|uniref:Hint domain-containing protein n=1 Tax=Tateyamaria pelophila TaxID=328415 RepID=UPI001CC11205|nr:Hint domain-containing protein [Tateyamaria pelophila]
MTNTANTDVDTSTQVINPDSNNPESITQTSTLFTTDNGGLAEDEFCVSVTITEQDIPETLNIVVVIDQSGSTSGSSGTDFTGDGNNDSILVAELFAAQQLFDGYVAAGYDPSTVTVSVVSYNSSAQDRGTFQLDDPTGFTNALTAIGNEGPGGTTNYVGALNETANVLGGVNTGSPGDPGYPGNLVVFMSDGFPVPSSQASGNPSPIETAATNLENSFGASINGIGVGANSSLNALNQLDNTGGANQVLTTDELLAEIVAPLTDAELVEINFEIEGLDTNGDPLTQTITLLAGDPRIILTPTGYSVNQLPIDPAFDPGTDVTVTVTSVFEPDPGAVPSPGPNQVITTSHDLAIVVCFTPGTYILTPQGATRIEDLTAGDRVITRDHGIQTIRWIGATTMSGPYAAANKRLRPILIRKDAFGPDQPERDMRVSRQHRFLVRDWRADVMFGAPDGVLVPAFALCNDSTIVEVRPTQDVTYIHMVFDNHEVVYADGVEAESFHPAARTVAGLKSDQRAELLELFPDLVDGAQFAYTAARGELRGNTARVLSDRN